MRGPQALDVAADALRADDLPCGWLRVTPGGLLLAANRPLLQMLGRPADDIQGARIDLLLSGSARVLYHSYLLPLLRLHGRVEEFALALRHADGRAVDVLAYGSAGTEGTIDLVLVPMRERRRLEDELLRVRRAAEMAPGVIFQAVADAAGGLRLPYASEALRVLYALAPEDVAASAQPLLDRIHPEDRLTVETGLRSPAASGTDWRAQYRVLLPGRALAWHEAHAVARQSPDGATVWHGFVADVTRRRELEASLGAKEAAESASRAKSEFLARVSHELRTPLNGILGFTRLLAFGDDASQLTAEQRRKIEIIETAGRNLLQLINEVLDITRIEQGRVDVTLRPVLLRPVLEQALRLVESQAMAAQVEIVPLVCAPRLAVRADERRLLQVAVNLLSNAVKYNHAGGRVVVAAAADGERVRLAVSDTGPGLDDDQQKQLFQPFNRLGAERSTTEGTGLGLVITRSLVELMGGRIGVDSAPGRGSIFSVWLDASEPPGPPAAEPSAAADAPSPDARRRVLYVEDNPVNVLLMEALVELRPGLELQVAESAAVAERLALREPPDLFLLDQHLPDSHGVELLQRLRAHPPLAAIPAVMVSADALPEDRERALAAGCVDYWTKPLDVDATLARLDRLVGTVVPAA